MLFVVVIVVIWFVLFVACVLLSFDVDWCRLLLVAVCSCGVFLICCCLLLWSCLLLCVVLLLVCC